MSPSVFYEIQMILAEGDMSVGWIYGVIGVHNWQIALFDDRAGRDVFESDTSTIIASTYMPKGKTTPVEGGYTFSGRWQFSSGSYHAQWFFLGGQFPGGGEGIPSMGTFLIPRADVEIIDTWDTSGLKATGSHDVVVKDAFVPTYPDPYPSAGLRAEQPRQRGEHLAAVSAAVRAGVPALGLDGIDRRIAGVARRGGGVCERQEGFVRWQRGRRPVRAVGCGRNESRNR